MKHYNILIDINHPAHVHLFRNAYFELVRRGHNVVVVVKDIPSAINLLDLYGIPYINIGHKNDAMWHKGLDQLIYDWRILRIAWEHKIDIGLGSSINIPHASRLSKMVSIILDDDDDAVEPLFAKYAHPFSDVIFSPEGTERKSKKVQYVPTYHELAYLHPNCFTPDPKVLDDASIAYEQLADGSVSVQPYFVLRFNAFKAHHDVGVVGLTIENKRRLVNLLSQYGKVLITTERNIDDEFLPYQLRVPQDKIHSLLYYATMFVGDSQTMTSEAAVLGTPAIRCNTFVGRIHYLEEEEHRYGLTYGFLPDQNENMFAKIEELLSCSPEQLKKEWAQRRSLLLKDKIDYTAFLLNYIENDRWKS